MAPQTGRFAPLSRALGLIWFSIQLHWAEYVDAFRRDGFIALVRLRQIRDAALARLFSITSSGFVAFEDTTIVPSLVQAASGIVLDLGPGAGNQVHRFNTSLVERIYGIEPNADFKNVLDAKLHKHGLQDRYKLVVCGVEDSDVLRREGITEGSLDSVLCIQVLCAVKDPGTVMKEVYKLLKPGGKFIFWEHGWSKDRLTMTAQALLNPAWSTFVGCHLSRNVKADILNAGDWENLEEIDEPEDRNSLLPRIQGVLIKRA